MVRDLASLESGLLLEASVAGATVTGLVLEGGLIAQDVIAGVAGSTCVGIIGSASGFVDAAQAGAPGASIAVAFWEQTKFMQFVAVPAFWNGAPPDPTAGRHQPLRPAPQDPQRRHRAVARGDWRASTWRLTARQPLADPEAACRSLPSPTPHGRGTAATPCTRRDTRWSRGGAQASRS
jgi:hypothetical protein